MRPGDNGHSPQSRVQGTAESGQCSTLLSDTLSSILEHCFTAGSVSDTYGPSSTGDQRLELPLTH